MLEYDKNWEKLLLARIKAYIESRAREMKGCSMGFLVSIVVPVYKAEKFLHRCIDSILQQTYRNIEIIIVNDGSPDRSGAICNKHAELDSRINVIHKENEGVSAARNSGLAKASGEYILFVDCDDYLEKTMVEDMLDSAIKHDSDIVLCSYNQIEKSSRYRVSVDNRDTVYSKDEFITYLLNAASEPYFNPPWNKLFRTNVMKKNSILFNTSFSLGEDFLFNLSVIEHGKIFSTVSASLYNYVAINPNSLTRKYRPDMWENQRKMFIFYKDFFVRNGFYEIYKKKVNAFILTSIKIYLSDVIGATTDIKSKKKNLKIIKNDPLVIEILKEVEPKDITSKMVLFCISHNLDNTLICTYSIKSFVYKRLIKVYHLLKKINQVIIEYSK